MALSALHATTKENRELRGVVDNLVQTQSSLIARSDKLEMQYIQLVNMLKQREESADDIEHNPDQVEEQQIPAVKKKKITVDEQNSEQLDKNKRAMVDEEKEMDKNQKQKKPKKSEKDSRINPDSEQSQSFEKDKASNSKTAEIAKLRKVKLEKVEEMKQASGGYQHQHQQYNCSCDPCIRKKNRKGMEVGLTSPNSAQLVALGTIQNSDATSIGLDGKPLSDYVEVMVNIVYKNTTNLPRPHGRLTKMGNAQAKCIPWPRNNVTSRNRVDDSQVQLPAKTKYKKKPNDGDTESQVPEMNESSRCLLNEATNSQSKLQLSMTATSKKESGDGDTESQEAIRKLKSLDLVNGSITSQSKQQSKKRPRSKKQSIPVDAESQATAATANQLAGKRATSKI